MSKQYGLILPGQQKKPVVTPRELQRPSIFDEDSSSESDGNAPPRLKPKTIATQGPSAMERRLARSVHEKALEEDPTIFQYDEHFDEMESKREAQKQTKAMEPKKPKYIARLLETAEQRKLENELRIERQVQKEREAEGDEFKDKEAFVTAAYRKKLEEIRKMQEKEKREEYLEAIGDVTKQKDLDGFYRHLYEQKLGSTKNAPDTTSADDNEISYKPITSGKPSQQRSYRKRHSTDDEMESKNPSSEIVEAKKVHLSNNIDADSDFSIDSSSSDDEDEKVAKVTTTVENTSEQIEKKVQGVDEARKNVDGKTETISSVEIKLNELGDKGKVNESPNVEKPKQKIDIWKKRTVGEVYEAAVQRYYERKAARSA